MLEPRPHGSYMIIGGSFFAVGVVAGIWTWRTVQFQQDLLDQGQFPSTLKVYVAVISCQHSDVDGRIVGSHKQVSLFLSGPQRLHPPIRPTAPAWDLMPYVCPPLSPWGT